MPFFVDPRQRHVVDRSGLFDARWYLAQYPDVERTGFDALDHYLAFGWREGRSPGPDFDSAFYRAAYPDVAAAGLHPLEHYLIHGARHCYRTGAFGEPFLPRGADPPSTGAVDPAITSQAAVDALLAIAARIADGRTLLQVGSPGHQALQRLPLFLARGAASARHLLVERDPALDRWFHALAGRLELPDAVLERLAAYLPVEAREMAQPAWSEVKTRHHWSVLADFFDPALASKAGKIDVLLLSDPLVVVAEPLQYLQRAAALAREAVCFAVVVSPPLPGGSESSWPQSAPDAIVSARCLQRGQRAALLAHWRDRGVVLQPYDPALGGHAVPSEAVERLGSAWRWFMGEGAAERLCSLAGLALVHSQRDASGYLLMVQARPIAGSARSD